MHSLVNSVQAMQVINIEKENEEKGRETEEYVAYAEI